MKMCPPIACMTVAPAAQPPQDRCEPHLFLPLRFSPVQVATHTDHSFPSSLQTNITFEGRARPSPLAVWPFGAPVLLLRCCHGRYSFVPRVPLSPLKHTYKRPRETRNLLRPTVFGQASKFSNHYWPECLPIIQNRKEGLVQKAGGGKMVTRLRPYTMTIG